MFEGGESVAAVAAGPVEHDIVLGHLEVDLPREPFDALLERAIVERGDPAAAVADQVLVVLAGREQPLVARHALANVEATDELELHEQVEVAVDARQTDAMTGRAKGIVDLPRGERARLRLEEVDERAARLRAPVARASQDVEGVVPPGCGRRVTHVVRA